MANISFPPFGFINTYVFVGVFCIILFFFPIYSLSHNVPALYIFGDSTIDAGNNNHLKGVAVAGHFGIDSNNGKPNGRYTNGKTIADFLATKLGLPLVPAYYDLSNDQKKNMITGINYGSGGCGILPGTMCKNCSNLDKQISQFGETVTKDLVNAIPNHQELDLHLSNSLFLISIGTNDYLQNQYRMKEKGFPSFLLEQLSLRLKRLIDLGGKRFLVNNISPLGCIPAKSNGSDCVHQLNTFAKVYADELPKMLHNLKEEHKDTSFSYSDNFKFFEQVKSKGILNIKNMCVNNTEVCKNRDKYFFFDGIHTTQAANSEFIDGCFNKSLCIPNVEQLISDQEEDDCVC